MSKILSLEGSLTVKNSSAFLELIIDSLNGSEELSLDLSECDSIDMCGLQLLESARIHADEENKTISLDRPAIQLLEILGIAGFISAEPSESRRFWLHDGVAQ